MDDLDSHPDLNDQDWLRAAERRASTAVRRMRRRAALRRHGNKIASVLALVVIAGVLVGLYRMNRPALGTDALLGPVRSPVTTTRATVTPSRPFAGTPAESWADGAAGIVLPPAAPVGSYTADQVRAAMEQVRQVVVAARLDRRMLEGHDPAGYLGLLAPKAADNLRPEFAPGHEADAANDVSEIAAGYPLLPVEPKVNGTMSARVGDDGQLVVHTQYVFAYAFRPESPDSVTSPLDLLVVSRFDSDYTVVSGPGWDARSRGVWPGTAQGYAYSIGCTLFHQGFLAPSFSDHDWDRSPAPSKADAYFDPNRPIPTDNDCPQ